MSNQQTGDTLVTKITGDISGLLKAFTQAGAAGKKFGQTIASSSTFASAAAGFNKISAAATGVVAPLLAAGAAFMSVKSVFDSMERAESLTRAARGLGLTTDSLAKLHVAAELSSSSAGELDLALRNMTRFMSAAQTAGGEASKAVEAMGMSVRDLNDLDASQAFGKIADGLNRVEDVGKRAALAQTIFGRSSRGLSNVLKEGSAGIKSIGDEAERTGRIMSRIEVAKLMLAKDATEKLGVAFKALADRLSVALAPIIRVISEEIDAMVGNTKRFDSVFQSVARSVIIAVGFIKAAWLGLTLMWEGAKVVIGTVGTAIWNVARVADKAFSAISQTSSKTWELLKASGAVVVDSLVYSFNVMKSAGVSAFAFLQRKFGEALAQMGANAASVPGLATIGDKMQAAGDSLVSSANAMEKGATQGLQAAGASLAKSRDELDKAAEAFDKPLNLDNEYLDRMTANIEKFALESVDSFNAVFDEIANATGGDAVTDMLQRMIDETRKMEEEATKIVAEEGASRAVIRSTSMLDGLRKTYTEAQKYLDEHHAAEIKKEVDARNQIAIIRGTAEEANRAQNAETDKQYAELIAMAPSRQYAASQQILKDRIAAEEELTAAVNMTTEQREAKLSTIVARDEKARLDERLNNAAKWQSGIKGKAETIGGILGDLSTLMQSENRKAFEVGKAAAISEATISTLLGAQKAFTSLAEIPIVGVPLGIAAAGAALAAGFMRVQQISSTQFKGGGGAGAASATGGATSSMATAGATAGGSRGSGQADTSSNVNIALHGDSFSASQVRGLIAAINDQVGDNVNLKTQLSMGPS